MKAYDGVSANEISHQFSCSTLNFRGKKSPKADQWSKIQMSGKRRSSDCGMDGWMDGRMVSTETSSHQSFPQTCPPLSSLSLLCHFPLSRPPVFTYSLLPFLLLTLCSQSFSPHLLFSQLHLPSSSSFLFFSLSSSINSTWKHNNLRGYSGDPACLCAAIMMNSQRKTIDIVGLKTPFSFVYR